MAANDFERLKTVSSSHTVLKGTRRKKGELREIREPEIKMPGSYPCPLVISFCEWDHGLKLSKAIYSVHNGCFQVASRWRKRLHKAKVNIS